MTSFTSGLYQFKIKHFNCARCRLSADMKEKIFSEINNGISRGIEYTSETTKNAVSWVELITRSYLGETILERSEGRWVPHRVKPGIRDLIRIRR